ncbi:MAG: hypothetical protein ACPGVB_07570 [Chitinophagales bacterium]
MNTNNQNIEQPHTNTQPTPSKDFHFTAITWKDVTDKVNFRVIEDLLNERLTLTDYGEAVKNLYGTFLVIQANNEFHDEFVDYDLEEQILEMAFKVDIRLLKDATKDETIQRMAKAFLGYIRQYPTIEGFDSKRFYVDVQSVFAEKGWLVEIETEVSPSNLTLSEKAQVTGLEEAIVYLIETDIDKAALGWIKVYCEKLKVKYWELMPKLFIGYKSH